MAKVEIEQAIAIALANAQGSILKVELEDEDGFLVYNAEVVTSDKRVKEVKIDAGNGQVLKVENDLADDDGDEQDEEVGDREGDNN